MLRLLVRITGLLLQAVFVFVRFMLPWVWRLVQVMFTLCSISITGLFMGVPQSVNRIADSWISQATEAGLPLGYDPSLRTGAIIIASITLILGWLVIASLMVFIIRLIFGV